MFSKKVFKKDSKGKIRVLCIEAIEGNLIKISGLVGGKKVTHSSICKPKNIGKVNETTKEEQAVLEAKAIITKKFDEGYFSTIKEAEDEMVILPMLAKDFNKEKHKVQYPCYAQPKLDGMRALHRNNQFISRKGKVIDTVPHLNDLTLFFWKNDIILDGELYAHGLSFQENMKLIKKYRKGESEQIKFHVYDCISDKSYSERKSMINKLNHNKNIEIVKTVQIKSEKDLIEFHKENISNNYEGTIVRWGDEGYKVNGRSSNLLKYKDFIDRTYKVIDVEPSDKNPKQGVVICEGLTNKNKIFTFGCGMKFSHKEREEILKNKKEYIGRTAEIRFFEFTDDGIPRFPVCVGFRLDC